MIRAVEECDKFKLLLLEIRKEYSSDFEEKAWVSEDWHLLSGNDCLVNFELIENNIRVLGTSYFKVYRKNDNVLFNIILVSNSKNFVANYLTFADLVLSLTIHTPDGQVEVERTFEVSKEISPIDEMNNLMVEMPEIVSLKEGLPAYYVHVYTYDMPIWDNKIEAQKLLSDLSKIIDPNVQINSKPYGRSIKYTVYYGPYPSKLEAARMAKKIKNAGYSFYIKLTPNA